MNKRKNFLKDFLKYIFLFKNENDSMKKFSQKISENDTFESDRASAQGQLY